MIQAVKYCFKNYFVFSGRTSRSQYWYFVLFLLIVHIVLILLSYIIYGPEISIETRIYNYGTENEKQIQVLKKRINSGWAGLIFSLVTLIPYVSAKWRRMHDVGRAGWFSILPWILVILSLMYTFSLGTVEVFDENNNVIQNKATIEAQIMLLISIISFIYVFFLLIRRSEPNPNKYGDPPA